MPCLKAMETWQAEADRQVWKVRLVRGQYDGGFSAEEVRALFRLIDWLMELPPGLDALFLQEIEAFEREKQMPYITSAERIGRERGLESGLRQGREEGREEGLREGLLNAIRLGLERKFGAAGLQVMPEVEQLREIAVLQRICDVLWTATYLDTVRQVWKT